MITWAERAKSAISKTGQGGTAKTDETASSRLLAVSAVPAVAASAMPELLSSVLAVPAHAALEKCDDSIAVAEDPDRWCWPHSTAMNGAEIETFKSRLHQFNDRGLDRSAGEVLADMLVLRDRDQDDQRVCLECTHFAGTGAGSWSCGNWQAAGVALCSRDAQLPNDLVVQLQHCGGFEAHGALTTGRKVGPGRSEK